MNFEKVLEMGWEDLALGIVGSAVVMLFVNFFTMI